MPTTYIPSAVDLDAFREVQRLAYRCAETIAAEITPGITERETAARMKLAAGAGCRRLVSPAIRLVRRPHRFHRF